jgi:AraC-like DNA-binding protein
LNVKCRHSDALVYILSGSCTYEFAYGDTFTVNKGEILYLAHQADYTMYIHTDEYTFIFCDFEFNETSPRKSGVYTPHNPDYSENLFIKLFKNKDSFADALSVLYSIYGIVMKTENKVYISKSSQNKISESKDYIDANFKDTSLSVELLAEKAGMSNVYFRKLFKTQYHLSPSQYIISMRLKNAKSLMKYSFLSLEECALQSGFSTLQYFYRVFKKCTGMTPSEYRRK